jgi:tRNA (guanine37-N1)-methyltransferase
VPAVLLSGDHAKVDAYRLETAIALTEKNRPELLEAWRIANPPPPPKKKRKKKSATVQEAVPVEISEEVLS